MCGIAGSINLRQGIEDRDRARVRTMMAHQAARGPDDSGFWTDDAVCALGHNRLTILDLSDAGRQPMASRDWVLVYNGEIYNFRDLRAQLEASDVTVQSSGDTEVLLACIQHYGLRETLPRLNGMFAFAAWHKPSQTLYLVRDRLGIKPLYYHWDAASGRLLFASMTAPIVRALGGRFQLDREALRRFYSFGATLGQDCLFQGVKRLNAASILTLDVAGPGLETWWRPTYREADIPALVADAVRIRHVSDVPLVLFLSGGIDSSTVAACSPGKRALHVYSQEMPYAVQAAETLGVELQVVDPFDQDYPSIQQRFSRFCGEPSTFAMMPYIVADKMARSAKVGLSGNGGDELFFGYPRLPCPTLPSTLHQALKALGENASAESSLAQLRTLFRPLQSFQIPGLPPLTDDAFYDLLPQPVVGDFPPCAEARLLELSTYIRDDLNPTLDFASMAHSVEMRVPFLDHRLVEAALSLPDHGHISAEQGRKSLLKNMLAEAGLSRRFWQRPKQGFSPGTMVDAALHPHKVDALQAQERRGLLRLGLHFRPGAAGARDYDILAASALAMEAFCRVFVDEENLLALD